MHLKPQGATYTGELEEFVTGTPLALTDVVVNPNDGAMYFAGRRPEDAVGPVSRDVHRRRIDSPGRRSSTPAPRRARACGTSSRASTATPTRKRSRRPGPTWDTPTASSAGRPGSRSSSRTRQTWRERALARELKSRGGARGAAGPGAGLGARTRCTAKPGDPPPDPSCARPDPRGARSARLGQARSCPSSSICCASTRWCLNRFGRPDDATVARLIARFDPHYPARSRELNAELANCWCSCRRPTRRPRRWPCWNRRRRRKSRSNTPACLRVLKTGLDAGAAQGVLRLVRQGGRLQGGQQLPRLHQEHQARRRRQSQRRREDGARTADRGQAGRSADSGGHCRSTVRQELDARRAGVRWSSRRRSRIATSTGDAHCSPPRSASPAIASTTKGAGWAPTSPASPAGSAPATCSNRSSCPASDQRPVRGGDRSPPTDGRASPAGSSTSTATT